MTTRPHGSGIGGAVPRPAGLARMFTPDAIAVIGASESPGLARDLLLTLRSRGYGGSVYAVNPHRRDVLGTPCYPDVASVPAAVDLGIVLVPPAATVDVLADCARAKVPAVAVCSSGFAEMGGEAQALQAEIGRLAQAAGIRLLGPNCLGFIDVARNVPAMAIPPASVPDTLHAGPVGVISQSAGLLISTLEYGSQIGVGFSLLVSTGNEEDVEAADCLEYLLDDPQTRVVALILEAVRDGRRLLDLVIRGHALGKAVVALKLGRSPRGAEAVRTHTAALAGAWEIFDAACRDAGIETADTIAGLVDCAAFLSKRRPNVYGGLAAITISGGTKALVADLAERYGVRLADLAPQTCQRLSDIIPSVAVVGNPLDVSAAAIEDEEVLGRAVEALDDDPDAGVIALIMHLKKHGGSPAHQRLVRRFIAQHGQVSKQLVVISSIPEGLSGYWRTEAACSPVPFLNDLSALAALRSVTTAPAPVAWPPSAGDVEAVTVPPDLETRVLDALAHGTGLLTEVEAYGLLEAAGIPVARHVFVASRDEAIAAADRLGYPVALKVCAPGVAHKAAAGLVRLGLSSAGEVACAYEELVLLPGAAWGRQPPVLVQAMVADGVELLLGMRVDPQFGPVVVIGLGGAWAETLRDVQAGLAPMTPRHAEALIDRLRIAPMLRGRAARTELDIHALARIVSRFSYLAMRLAPYLSSLEINPLMVSGRGCVAVDALGQVQGRHLPDRRPTAEEGQ